MHSFISDVQFKILTVYHDYLWKTYGQQVANLTEQAIYNFIATLPKQVMIIKRFREKTKNEIGEFTE